ncbi:hypothetical protein BT63DRAFT_282276 [Microthyrium microscopicum]|uniref:Extracellular membrane protein CFEM domain-containing protein n=1 Tax=Microthyrium microscopicum TaxID=703497 RepID=A0A6A6U8Q9_9PEZI|nr:hypothetical protein BT63DRAFT_282276 [Microthyrium microscopicum]
MKKLKFSLAITFVLGPFLAYAQATTYTLSSFDQTPISGLAPACLSVYQQTIPGCKASDFVAMNACSADCITGIQTVQTQAQAACATASNVPSTSILSYFSKGQGVQQLCTNAKAQAGSNPTTLLTSIISSTPTPTASAGPEINGGDTMMSMSNSTVVAIIVVVAITSALLLLVAIVLYRKYYAHQPKMGGK